jgi:hypothetical protein
VIEVVWVKELARLLAMVILEPLPQQEVEGLALSSAFVRLEAGEDVALHEHRRTLLLLASGRVRVHWPGAGTLPSPWSRTGPL